MDDAAGEVLVMPLCEFRKLIYQIFSWGFLIFASLLVTLCPSGAGYRGEVGELESCLRVGTFFLVCEMDLLSACRSENQVKSNEIT